MAERKPYAALIFIYSIRFQAFLFKLKSDLYSNTVNVRVKRIYPVSLFIWMSKTDSMFALVLV